MRKIALATAILFGLLLPSSVLADNLARDYTYAPPGTALFLVYDYHLSAHTAYDDGKKVTDNANASGDIYIFRPVYYVDYGFLNLHGGQQLLFFAKDIDDLIESINGREIPDTEINWWLSSKCC